MKYPIQVKASEYIFVISCSTFMLLLNLKVLIPFKIIKIKNLSAGNQHDLLSSVGSSETIRNISYKENFINKIDYKQDIVQFGYY